ncbi:hypothetical protein [Methylobacterium sp. Leaf88]|uniref:hypothetical protein n=1 Tax=Methylobacterium sp. Leaf88 TaxID=1736244 RepID=UPI0006F5B736|nr:hypothetical protein [Methylobacterium sp. Leaf88]KQO61740.1 hypothetical protein ASF20_09730 [Methylobacterium sp. Leaf88]
MRIALILILLASPAAAAPEYPVRHTTAEYVAAYGKARAYAQAHSPLKAQPTCRKAIGRRASMVLEQRCRDVAGGTRSNCTTHDVCEDMITRLTWHCAFWQGDVPCVYDEDGGAIRNPAPAARP